MVMKAADKQLAALKAMVAMLADLSADLNTLVEQTISGLDDQAARMQALKDLDKVQEQFRDEQDRQLGAIWGPHWRQTYGVDRGRRILRG
jgi:hypothetical protein